MQVHCKSCSAPVLADDVNLERFVAKCRRCHAVFDFSAQLSPPAGSASPPRPAERRRPPVPLPAAITVNGDVGSGPDATYRTAAVGAGRGSLEIVRRWFTHKYLLLLVFCVGWNGFLVFWYSMSANDSAPWIMFVFPLVHVAVGVALTYSTIAGLVNRSVIRVTGDELSIRHGPVPWLGNRRIPIADLRQLYCEEHVNTSSKGTTRTYRLNANVAGRKITLLADLPEPDQALYIEQKLEQHLGIVDIAVGDEYRAQLASA